MTPRETPERLVCGLHVEKGQMTHPGTPERLERCPTLQPFCRLVSLIVWANTGSYCKDSQARMEGDTAALLTRIFYREFSLL